MYGVSVVSYLARDLLVVEIGSITLHPDAAMLYFFIKSIRFLFASICKDFALEGGRLSTGG